MKTSELNAMLAAPRETTAEDDAHLLEMAHHFYHASGYSEVANFSERTLVELFGQLREAPGGYLRRTDHGMLAGVAFPVFFDSESLLAQELMWWVEPAGRQTGEGGALLSDFEAWAQAVGANATMMLNLESLDSEGLAQVYGKRGYNRAEQSWMRVH